MSCATLSKERQLIWLHLQRWQQVLGYGSTLFPYHNTIDFFLLWFLSQLLLLVLYKTASIVKGGGVSQIVCDKKMQHASSSVSFQI